MGGVSALQGQPQAGTCEKGSMSSQPPLHEDKNTNCRAAQAHLLCCPSWTMLE
jgi:hypothetical protein